MKTADNPYVSEMLRLISQEFMHDIKLSEVAARININVEYAGKLFRSHTNLSFSEYQNRYKLDQIIRQIKEDHKVNIEQLAMENGFSEIRTFYRVFKKIFNMTPGEYREKYLDRY